MINKKTLKLKNYIETFRYLKEFKLRVLIVILLSTIGSISSGLSIGLIIPLLDGNSRDIFEDTPFKFLDDFLNLTSNGNFETKIILTSSLIIFFAAIDLLMRYINLLISNHIDYEIRNNVLNKIKDKFETISYKEYFKKSSGESFTILTTDPGKIGGINKRFLLNFYSFLSVIIFSTVMFLVSPFLTIFSVVFFIFVNFLSTRIIEKNLITIQRKIASKQMVLNSQAQNSLQHFKVLRVYQQLMPSIEKLLEEYQEQFNNMKNYYIKSGLTSPVGAFFNTFSIGLLLMFGTYLFRNEDKTWLVMLIPFLVLLFKILPSISSLNALRININSNYPYVERVEEFIKRDLTNVEKPDNLIEMNFKDKIKINNLKFGYDNNSIFNDLTFEIPKNSTVGIFGPSGAGKSTLFDIFLKLYTDYEGEIIIDDTNLKGIQDSSFYKDIAYMPQEGVFINDTLEKNFNMLSNVTSDEEFLNILKKLGISDLTSKLQSILGQGGINLSSGQKQKINFIRSFLKPSSMFLLDEPSSNLDFESEQNIFELLENIKNQKTILLISHSRKFIDLCDYILIVSDLDFYQFGERSAMLETPYFKKLIEEKVIT